MSTLDDILQKLCPNGVEYKEIGEISQFRRGSFPQPYTNSAFYGGEGAMPFIQVGDMHDYDFQLDDRTNQTISEIAQPKSIFVKSGSILVSIQGTLGRVSITQYNAYVDRTIAIFKDYENFLIKRFFAYILKFKFDYEKKFARGSTLKTITIDEFSKFKIPVPPLEIQNKIVYILDTFTELKENLKKEFLYRKKQYDYYRNLVFNSNKDNILFYTLDSVCTKITDGSHFSPKAVDKGYFMPSVKNMTQIGFDFSDCKQISKNDYELLKRQGCKPKINDVLIAKDGSMLKYVFTVEEDIEIVVLSSIAILSPNSSIVNSKYLEYYFKSENVKNRIIREYSSKGGVPRIVLKNFKKILIPIPPLEEQEHIVTILNHFDLLCNAPKASIPAEMELRQKQYEYYRDKLLSFDKKE